jgi:hypothetical protein
MVRALPGLRLMKPLRSRVSTIVDGWRGDGEEALDVGFSGRPSDCERIGMNKGQVLALLVGEFLDRGVHAT